MAGRIYFTLLDLRGQTYQTIQGIQRSSVDYYSSLRSLYRQMRPRKSAMAAHRARISLIFDVKSVVMPP